MPEKKPERPVPRCPRCEHSFYSDVPVRDGLCKWCVEEINSGRPVKVLVIFDAPLDW
jgi:hypothetical protein